MNSAFQPYCTADNAERGSDPYYHQRVQALVWLGDRYLLAHPINRKPENLHNRRTENV